MSFQRLSLRRSLHDGGTPPTRQPQHVAYSTPQQQHQHQRRRQQQHSHQKAYQTPLVLDPATATTTTAATPTTTPLGGKTGFLTERTNRRRRNETETKEEEEEEGEKHTAAAFARTASRAGFLHKMGSNIPEWKRRFFVLKASTHLYYFLSPSDTEPRGCLDLEDVSKVERIDHLPDGRFRFVLHLDGNDRVLLEARSQDVGREWLASLEQEQLSYAKTRCTRLQQLNNKYKTRIAELEKEISAFRLVEQDRDGALQDAANWQNAFDQLNEALRLLALYLRRTNTEQETKNDTDANDLSRDISLLDDEEEEEEDDDENDAIHAINETDDTPRHANDTIRVNELDVPGTHFSTLSNMCMQLRENVRLASVEAATAIEDVAAANRAANDLEKKYSTAQGHVCKLWEENCAIRQELKVTKQEKKILIREVKALRTSTQQQQQLGLFPQEQIHRPVLDLNDSSSSAAASLAEEGERLIEELEEHVMNSIRLHEEFLGSNNKQPHQPPDVTDKPRAEGSSWASDDPSHQDASPLRPKVLSLFDDDDDDDDSEEEQSSVVSSIGAQMGDDGFEKQSLHDYDVPNMCASSSQSESTRSVVTENGQATFRLVGPPHPDKVYHLTFYSQKIGLQFQKVSLPLGGLLTEAMAADLPDDAELRMVAEMSKRAKADTTPMASNHNAPVHAVLVCGFLGFDENKNDRPELGARLVAFDGVSVERGAWTFDAIRKAIQTRARPLTLSFRNDGLTTQQGHALTRAVNQVRAHNLADDILRALDDDSSSLASSTMFSEASTTFSAASLVANLMARKTPTYLKSGEGEAVESIPYHQNFQASLL